jgi:hypothetical protein
MAETVRMKMIAKCVRLPAVWLGCAFFPLMGWSMISLAEVGGNERAVVRRDRGAVVTGTHLSVGHRIRDVLNHPAFTGYGELLLPWDDRGYDQTCH